MTSRLCQARMRAPLLIFLTVIASNGQAVMAFTGYNVDFSKPQSAIDASSVPHLESAGVESSHATRSDRKFHCTLSRRGLIVVMQSLSSYWASSPAFAKASPEMAFDNLLKARIELVTAAKNYLVKGDYTGMREYLETANNMNSYEENAQALLESKRLDVESKKEIGTIRRYGVGADVIIMYGGLRTELSEEPPDSGQVKLYWTRALDSLDEVITICRNNGL